MPDIVLKSFASMPCCRIEGNRVHQYGHLLTNLKKLCCLFFAVGLVTVSHGRAEAATQREVAVASYIVKETGSSNVIMAKDIDRQVSPASLTKILTSIMAIESGRLNDEVVIAKEATLVEPTKAGFRPGDRILLRDLVKAAMVNSSNDAAFAIAIHLGGSVDSFVASMNARARALGMNNSCFTNPAGFDVGPWVGNRTTARDLMVLTEHAVRNPEFNSIARLDRATFKELSTGRAFSLKTHNKMLELYPYSVGIKTGFTNRAGKCLIARAIKDRKDLLMVMLNARADRWAIASNMFDQGFGINSSDRLPMPAVARQDSDIARPASSRQVAIERAKALDAIRLKVARQSATASMAGVRSERTARDERQVAMGSRHKGRVDTRSALRMRKQSAIDRKLALKAAKNDPKGKRVVFRSKRNATVDTKLALKSKNNAKARVVALKSSRKAKSQNRAEANQKKKGGEVTRVSRPKQRKVAISSLVSQFARPAEV